MNASELALFYDRPRPELLADPDFDRAHQTLLEALESGALRAAAPDGQGGWTTHAWVKQALLAAFAAGGLEPFPGPAFDRPAFPPRRFTLADGVRLVPGGSAVRRGAHVAPGVVIMPPAYVNVGAFIDQGSMIDSHALVGSCAQVGKRVHVSAGAQLGGVLEPAGQRPVILEDEVFVGGLTGLFEGVLVRRRAVLAPGVLLTQSTRLYDLVQGRTLQGEVPEDAVVVPGSRPALGAFARGYGLQLFAPCIVKYRDPSTDAATALEEALR